ncbi:hypothetical protein R6Z07M_016924 [Ovis aries]
MKTETDILKEEIREKSAPFCVKCGIVKPYRVLILICSFTGSALLWWAFNLSTWVKIENSNQSFFSALFAICSDEIKCWVPPSKSTLYSWPSRIPFLIPGNSTSSSQPPSSSQHHTVFLIWNSLLVQHPSLLASVCLSTTNPSGPLGSPSEACGRRESQTPSVRRVTGSALPSRGAAPAAAGEREELSIVSNYGLETFWSQKEDSLESFLLWVVNTT